MKDEWIKEYIAKAMKLDEKAGSGTTIEVKLTK